jgi:hypothetical protein
MSGESGDNSRIVSRLQHPSNECVFADPVRRQIGPRGVDNRQQSLDQRRCGKAEDQYRSSSPLEAASRTLACSAQAGGDPRGMKKNQIADGSRRWLRAPSEAQRNGSPGESRG